LDLKLLNTATFFGVGYLLGQFFNNKYIIQYGVSITFGWFDGIEMPNTPRCICRVHKYSDMWKWFDHGLYEFLFKYIYTSVCTKRSSLLRKIFAGFTTFLFIYFWHGFFDYILIWSILNCVCIVLEKFVYHVIEGESFRRKALDIVKTDNNVHRLHSLIGSHVLIPAIISNLFFFGGIEVGWEFIRRTYLCGFGNYLKISMCIYFLYPVAEAIKRWEKMK
jgi:protein-cysteine N-palmitoyltransferase HHAT